MGLYLVNIEGREYTVQIQSDGEIKLDGFDGRITCEQVDPNTCSVLLNRTSISVVSKWDKDSYQVLLSHRPAHVGVETERDRLLRRYASSSGKAHKRLEVHAPMPALVVRIEVAVGQEVEAGQGLFILEAMKMENEIKAHQAGKVKDILVTEGITVEKGQLVMLLE